MKVQYAYWTPKLDEWMTHVSVSPIHTGGTTDSEEEESALERYVMDDAPGPFCTWGFQSDVQYAQWT